MSDNPYDDPFELGFARGYEAARALVDEGVPLEKLLYRAMARVDTWAREGSELWLGALYGANAMVWQALGYEHGVHGLPKERPPEYALKGYLHGYRQGTLYRHEVDARAKETREALQRLKALKETARGQGGPGVQLRLIEGGKKGAT